MGTAGAKAVGDMLLVNKTLQTLDVSDNSFDSVQKGEHVKLLSSGEMCEVFISDEKGIALIVNDKKDTHYRKASEWESGVQSFCAGVATSSSLTSVSTTFKHALAVLFLTPPLFPTMYVAPC